MEHNCMSSDNLPCLSSHRPGQDVRHFPDPESPLCGPPPSHSVALCFWSPASRHWKCLRTDLLSRPHPRGSPTVRPVSQSSTFTWPSGSGRAGFSQPVHLTHRRSPALSPPGCSGGSCGAARGLPFSVNTPGSGCGSLSPSLQGQQLLRC